MTRETKLGLAMVLLLAGVFGFLVYKRATQPGDLLAQVEETAGELAADGETADPEKNSVTSTSDEEFSAFGQTETEPDETPVAKNARQIPESEDSDSGDPFNTAAPLARVATTLNTPKMPTMIPDDEPAEMQPDAEANNDFLATDPSTNSFDSEPEVATNAASELTGDDPFAGGNNLPANEPKLFSAPTAAMAREKPEAVELEEFEDFSAPTTVRTPVVETPRRDAPVMTEPLETANREPSLSFEAAEPTDVGEPAVNNFNATPVAQPIAAPVARSAPLVEATKEEEVVSVRARATRPESSFDFADEAEAEPVATTNEPILSDAPTSTEVGVAPPQLMLDDSDEDRYGGYKPIELVVGESAGDFATEVVIDEAPRRVPVDLEPTAVAAAPRASTPSIAGDRYVVQPGDNFWSISQKKYGAGRYFQALAAYNQSRVSDASRMKPGVEIALPDVEELTGRFATLVPADGPSEPAAAVGAVANAPGEFLQGADGQPRYRIGTGDTLSGIAQKHLGRSRRWEQILEMNRDVLKDGNSLKLGAVLRLPSDATNIQLSTQPRMFR